MILAVILPAFAADPAQDWAVVFDARLAEVADGTPDNAVRLYRGILEDMDPTLPLYAFTSFAMGRALLGSGEVDEGMVVIAAINDHSARGRLRDEAGAALRMASLGLWEDGQLTRNTIPRLPVRWGFENDTFPAVRGSTGDGRGTIAVGKVEGRQTLEWATNVRPGDPDRMTLRFGPDAAPREVGVSARAVDSEAVLRLVAVDPWGQRWISPEWTVPVADWLDVRLGVRSFVPEEGGRGHERLDRVVDLRFEDISGERSNVRGANSVLLDDVYVL